MMSIGRGRAWAWLITLSALHLGLNTKPLPAQQPGRPDPDLLQRLLQAEDARGTGAAGVAPLMEGLTSQDSMVRRLAIRGLGRLQRSDLALKLIPFLGDPLPALRGEAANAITQGVSRARRGAATETGQLSVADATSAMLTSLSAEQNPSVAAAIAEALGRLPFADSSSARTVERAILLRVAREPSVLSVHGLYTLAKARRTTGPLSSSSLQFLRTIAIAGDSPEIRRLAILTLTTTAALDTFTTLGASRDKDAQVRRLAMAGVRELSVDSRNALVARAIADSSPIVRVVAIGAIRVGSAAPDCSKVIDAVKDRDPYVALTAIDSLGAPCASPAAAVTTLSKILDGSLKTFAGPADHRWQAGAHALRALAKLDSARVITFLPKFTNSTRVGERIAAANAAATAKELTVLRQLAVDADNNVREAALAGLALRAKNSSSQAFIAALAAPGYQVVLEAATALAGSGDPRALPALLDAFDRLRNERKENTKDARVMLLRRISEFGNQATAPRLTPYLADIDTLIAASVATTLSKWSGTSVQAHPAPLPIRVEPLAQTLVDRTTRLKVTMAASSGGGTFVIEVYGSEAPATVARIVRLAREHFYDGHRFQRVEPNFVVQGGGPDASEYVGDATFMRDELTARSHGIGTIGISSRGRDTGDAQWFINVVDNPLLDHEYTVFGKIIVGLGVARQILEGDQIEKVEVLRQ